MLLPNLPQHSKTLSVDDLTSDIENPRVKQIILNHKSLNNFMENDCNINSKQHQAEVKDCEMFLKQHEERKWLIRKGKKYLIDFDNQERREMKRYFSSLDEKKTGSIGIDELEQLLLSVGIFQTREEIKSLIDSVDEDKSGKIEFGEFLSMIQNDQGQNEEIVSFFKTVIGGKLNQHNKMNHPLNQKFQKYTSGRNAPKSSISQILQKFPYPKGLPFEMVVSHIRRKHMMTALNIGRATKRNISQTQSGNTSENTIEQIAKGQRVMQALQKMYERKLIRQIKQNKRLKNTFTLQSIKPKTKMF